MDERCSSRHSQAVQYLQMKWKWCFLTGAVEVNFDDELDKMKMLDDSQMKGLFLE
jgi:hypothetical protein